MICPYKLSAGPEDVARWLKASFPSTLLDDRPWRKGTFPIVSHDCDSRSVKVTPTLAGEETDEYPAQYVIAAGLLSSETRCRDAFSERRCLIPVSAFRVERRDRDGLQKGFELRLADEPLFALAGVWGAALTADGASKKVFTAITIHASVLLSGFFAQVPIVVAQGDYSRWLGIQSRSTLPTEVLRPFSAVEMKRWIMLPEDSLRADV